MLSPFCNPSFFRNTERVVFTLSGDILISSAVSLMEKFSFTSAANDHFGAIVSINGDYAIVGAYRKNISGNTYQGKAYFFKHY